MKLQLYLFLNFLILHCYSLPLNTDTIKPDLNNDTTTLPYAYETINKKSSNKIPLLEQTHQVLHKDNDTKILNVPADDPEDTFYALIGKSNDKSGLFTKLHSSKSRDYNSNNAFKHHKKSHKKNEATKNNKWDSTTPNNKMTYNDWNDYYCTEKYMDIDKIKGREPIFKKDTIFNSKHRILRYIVDGNFHSNKVKRAVSNSKEYDTFRAGVSERISDGIDSFRLDHLNGEGTISSKNWNLRNPLPFDNLDIQSIPLTNTRNMNSFINSKNIKSASLVNSEDSLGSTKIVPSTSPKSLIEPESKEASSSNTDSNESEFTGHSVHENSEEVQSASSHSRDVVLPALSDFNQTEDDSQELFELKNLKQSQTTTPVNLVKPKEDSHDDFLPKVNKELFPRKYSKEIPLSFLPNPDKVNFHLMSDSKKIESSVESNPFNDQIKVSGTSEEGESLEIPSTLIIPSSQKMKSKKESKPIKVVQKQPSVSQTMNSPAKDKIPDTKIRSNVNKSLNGKGLISTRRPKKINSPQLTDSKVEPLTAENQMNQKVSSSKIVDQDKARSSRNSVVRANGKRSTPGDTDKSDESKSAEKKEQSSSWEVPDVKIEKLPPESEEEEEDDENNDISVDESDEKNDSEENDYDISSVLARSITNLLTFYLYIRRTTTGLAGILNRIFGQ